MKIKGFLRNGAAESSIRGVISTGGKHISILDECRLKKVAVVRRFHGASNQRCLQFRNHI